MRDKCKRPTGKTHKFWDIGELCSTCAMEAAIFGCSDCLLVFCYSCSIDHCCCNGFTYSDSKKMLEEERQYG